MTNYVLDTSTLIYDPSIINEGYPNDNLIIPMTVIRELDNIKTEKSNKGVQARSVLKNISDLKDGSNEKIIEGIHRPCGGYLRVELNHVLLQDDDNIDGIQSEDDKIILVTKNLTKDGDEHILMTQDRSMSIIAETWGVKTTQHNFIDTSNDIPTGIRTFHVDNDLIQDLHEKGQIDEFRLNLDEYIPVNTGVILKCGSNSALAIANGIGELKKINGARDLYNLSPRGVEQKIAAELLMGKHNGEYQNEFLASLSGRPGGGKSTLAVSAGLQLVTEGVYDKILIFRPTVNLSSNTDLGFLPGSIEDKLAPWTEAVKDVLRGLGLSDNDENNNHIKIRNKAVPLDEIISVEPINFIRGRTFMNCFVIIDEAQNLEPGELRTLLTRFGKGSACVLTWDQGQIDNNFIRSGKAEGPLSVLEQTKDAPNVFHIDLPRCERGGISQLFV